MGFTIDRLMLEILKAPLDDEQKATLLTRLFKTGQLEKEVFLVKNDGEDIFQCYRRQINPENGRTEVVDTGYDVEDAINNYVLSVYKQEHNK